MKNIMMRSVLVLVFLLNFDNVLSDKLPMETLQDTLNSLKDAGVLNQFEERLKELLVKENEMAKDDEEKEFDFLQFIKSYLAEKKYKIDEKISLYLMDLKPEGNIAQHLTDLTTIMDLTAKTSDLSNKSLKTTIVNIFKRVKSVGKLKKQLEDIFKQESVSGIKSDDKKISKNEVKGDLEITGPKKVKLEYKKKQSKEKNKVVISILSYLEQLKEDPSPIMESLNDRVKNFEIMSPETLSMFNLYGNMLIETEYFITLMDMFIAYVEDMSETEFGDRFTKMVPDLMKAKDMQETMEIVYKETDLDMNSFLSLIQNSDVRNKLLDKVSVLLAATIKAADDFIQDEMKFSFVNTFFISFGVPPIQNSRFIESSLKTIQTGLKTLTGFDVNLDQYKDSILGNIHYFEEEYMPWQEYRKLSETEQMRLVSQFLADNMAEPIEYVFMANNHVMTSPNGLRCAEAMLCHLNLKVKSSGMALKTAITQGLSILASWGWGLKGDLDSWNLYEAVWHGKNSETCDVRYPSTEVKECYIFPWQSSLMSLDFEHNEL